MSAACRCLEIGSVAASQSQIGTLEKPEKTSMGGNAAIKVVLADDHQLVRAGFRSLLAGLQDIEVVAEASDGDELLHVLEDVPADVVVTDIGMPGTDGLAALRLIRKRHPAMKTMVLSMDDSAESIRTALASGASGYVRKDAPASSLATAVRAVAASGSYFGTDVVQRLAEPMPLKAKELLTDRQLQVLVMLADGRSTKEIAFDIGVSTKTVEVHRQRIMEQLAVNDVASLTRYAMRNGLIKP